MDVSHIKVKQSINWCIVIVNKPFGPFEQNIAFLNVPFLLISKYILSEPSSRWMPHRTSAGNEL